MLDARLLLGFCSRTFELLSGNLPTGKPGVKEM